MSFLVCILLSTGIICGCYVILRCAYHLCYHTYYIHTHTHKHTHQYTTYLTYENLRNYYVHLLHLDLYHYRLSPLMYHYGYHLYALLLKSFEAKKESIISIICHKKSDVFNKLQTQSTTQYN